MLIDLFFQKQKWTCISPSTIIPGPSCCQWHISQKVHRPGWKESIQADVLILETKWPGCEWIRPVSLGPGSTTMGAEQKCVKGRKELLHPPEFLLYLFLPSPAQEVGEKKHPKARRQNFPYFGQEGLLKARFETSCCGSVVLTGDGRDHHTSVLVLAFFASCGFPPFDLSEAFTHKDEHLVRSQG